MLDFNRFHVYTRHRYTELPQNLIQESIENARDFAGSSWSRMEDKTKTYLVAHMIEMSFIDNDSATDRYALTTWGRMYLLSII